MRKVIEAIEQMVAVEEAAQRCPDCVVGAFCSKHDSAFWHFWGQAKNHLTKKTSRSDDICAFCGLPYDRGTFCPRCGSKVLISDGC